MYIELNKLILHNLHINNKVGCIFEEYSRLYDIGLHTNIYFVYYIIDTF